MCCAFDQQHLALRKASASYSLPTLLLVIPHTDSSRAFKISLCSSMQQKSLKSLRCELVSRNRLLQITIILEESFHNKPRKLLLLSTHLYSHSESLLLEQAATTAATECKEFYIPVTRSLFFLAQKTDWTLGSRGLTQCLRRNTLKTLILWSNTVCLIAGGKPTGKYFRRLN